MRKTLETADHTSKVILAVCAIVFYVLELIKGPFAFALFILACITVITFLVRVAYRWLTID